MNSKPTLLNKIKGKIGEPEYLKCVECSKVILIDGESYCDDNKCLANKKRLYTRINNNKERYLWRKLEVALTKTDKTIFEDTIFPYIIIELLVEHSYDEEIKMILANKLRIKTSEVRKQGIKLIYTLESKEVKKIAELLVLRLIGLKRAEALVNKNLR